MPPAQSSCSDVSLPWQTAAKASTVSSIQQRERSKSELRLTKRNHETAKPSSTTQSTHSLPPLWPSPKPKAKREMEAETRQDGTGRCMASCDPAQSQGTGCSVTEVHSTSLCTQNCGWRKEPFNNDVRTTLGVHNTSSCYAPASHPPATQALALAKGRNVAMAKNGSWKKTLTCLVSSCVPTQWAVRGDSPLFSKHGDLISTLTGLQALSPRLRSLI